MVPPLETAVHPSHAPIGGTVAPARASGVELLGSMPGSGYRRPPGLVRRADGQIVQLTPLLYAVLDAIDGRRTTEEIAAAVSRRINRHATAEDVAFLVDRKLRPLGLVVGRDGTEPEVARANPLLALRFKFVITSPSATRRLTAPFARLFHPTVVLPTLVAFAVISWWLLFDKGLAAGAREAIYEPAFLLLVLALTLVSGGFHEFGHAAACRYGGATPGAMGAGLYVMWPAFYTDVTDSYRLGRGPAPGRPRRAVLQRGIRRRHVRGVGGQPVGRAPAGDRRAARPDDAPARAVHPRRRLPHHRRPDRGARPLRPDQADAARRPADPLAPARVEAAEVVGARPRRRVGRGRRAHALGDAGGDGHRAPAHRRDRVGQPRPAMGGRHGNVDVG